MDQRTVDSKTVLSQEPGPLLVFAQEGVRVTTKLPDMAETIPNQCSVETLRRLEGAFLAISLSSVL